MKEEFQKIIRFIKSRYGESEEIPLHIPTLLGNEKKYLAEVIDTNYVSYMGEFVGKFEESIAGYTKSTYAIAMVNGTSALHLALKLAGVKAGDEVITQPLTFVATSNAIAYCNASPVYLDVSLKTMGLDPGALTVFLEKNAEIKNDGFCYNKTTGKKISCCLPVHIFGHPAEITEIIEICNRYNIPVVEDAAESLGSFYNGKHTGTFGKIGVLSFNGNKIVTTGGGGMIITDDKNIAEQAAYLSTTAKSKHQWEYIHEETGYNYRLPNINAAVGFAQMENLNLFLESKRKLAGEYKTLMERLGIEFFSEPAYSRSNYWLNSIVLNSHEEREEFLQLTNDNGIRCRPTWKLMNSLPMYKNYYCGEIPNAEKFAARLVNLPSTPILK